MKIFLISFCVLLYSWHGLTQSWSDPVVISRTGSNSCSDFTIDKYNRFHCVWTQYSGWNYKKLFYSRSDTDGRTWLPPVVILDSTDIRIDNPHIAADTAGNLFVTFDMDPATAMKICYTTLKAGDTDWSQPVHLGFGLVNRVIVDKRNRVYFFWNSGFEIYRYFENDTLSDTFSVCFAPEPGCSLDDIEIDLQNTFHCIGSRFTEAGGDGAYYTFSDGSWNPYLVISPKTFYESSISLNSINNPSFIWWHRHPSIPGIFATYFSEIVNDTACQPVLLGENTSFPDIALDYSDKPHVVESQETDTNYQLMHRYRTNAGWISRVVEENIVWYGFNNLISRNNYLFWIYDKLDTLYNDTLHSYYANIVFRKLELPASATELSHLKNLAVWPNPFMESMVIQVMTDFPVEINIHIYDLFGRQVYNTTMNADTGTNKIHWNGRDLNGNDISKGIYIIHLNSEMTNNIVKVIRQ